MREQKSTKRAKSGKPSLLAAGVLLALLLGVLLAHRQLLQFVGDHLVRDDQAADPAEVGMLLMGDWTITRATRALQLYDTHKILKIALAEDRPSEFVRLGLQKSDAMVHVDFLRSRGVPANDIILLSACNTDSTLDEAHCLRSALMQTTPPRQIFVITSWYHTARAGWLFERVFAETGVKVQVAAATSDVSRPGEWWERKADFLAVFEEYLKHVYWLAKQPT